MNFAKFQTETRQPRVKLPPKACDSQVHIFGDLKKYPITSSATYRPPEDADILAALRMHKTLGIERGVIVQATAHGTDHQILYDALTLAGPNYRGVAIVNDAVTDKDLETLHAAGVRGARFNFWKSLNIAPKPDEFLRAIDRIKELGWFAKIHSAGDEWLELGDLLDKADLPIVIDHLGHPDLAKGLEQPAIQTMKRWMQRDNWWMMVSNFDRFSKQAAKWDDTYELVRTYSEAFPERVIWCTDWPHVKYEKTMPNDAELVEYITEAVNNPATLHRMLVDNPSRLFGFSN